MNLELTGKHALVCGGSQGIGLAAAIELATLGADVTLLARSPDALERALSALPRTHAAQQHATIAADMNEHTGLREKVEAAVNAHAVNILINNTGGPPGGPAHTAALDDFRIAFNQHLMAAQIVLQAALPGMQASRYGRIVNVISTSVKEPIRNLGVSNTIRGAMASWAKTLATELGAHGITVNNVLPGYTKTQRLDQILADRASATGKSEGDIAKTMLSTVPLGRFAEATEIASVIAFLATPAAGYVNGINVPVDGGRTLSL
ncbi:MAG: SDR family oxidoreductase [Rhodanobacteraceae bacterium]